MLWTSCHPYLKVFAVDCPRRVFVYLTIANSKQFFGWERLIPLPLCPVLRVTARAWCFLSVSISASYFLSVSVSA